MAQAARDGQGLRADAMRSRARVLESAVELVARDGAGVSLEAIARAAGVGSATLHRHFPTRWDLLEAIFKDRVEQLARRADELSAARTEDVFAVWFEDLVEMMSRTRALADVIAPAAADRRVQDPSSCHALIADAGQRLLDAEKDSGRIRPDVQIDELITLAMAISTLRDPDARNRLRGIVVNGWGSPSGGD
jgi:AcrR family transcriptional regulator